MVISSYYLSLLIVFGYPYTMHVPIQKSGLLCAIMSVLKIIYCHIVFFYQFSKDKDSILPAIGNQNDRKCMELNGGGLFP